MEIKPSAYRHDKTDEQILHALRHALRYIPMPSAKTLVIGPEDATANLLELIIVDIDTDDERVIHAMDLRPKFYEFL